MWNKSKDSNVGIELGSKFTLDKDAFIKAKVSNAGIVGLGYTQTLRKGVKVGFGGSFDTTRFNENVHKLGMSLSLEA